MTKQTDMPDTFTKRVHTINNGVVEYKYISEQAHREAMLALIEELVDEYAERHKNKKSFGDIINQLREQVKK